MSSGDVVEVEVRELGRLRNQAADAPAPANEAGHQPTDSDALRRVALGSDFVKRG